MSGDFGSDEADDDLLSGSTSGDLTGSVDPGSVDPGSVDPELEQRLRRHMSAWASRMEVRTPPLSDLGIDPAATATGRRGTSRPAFDGWARRIPAAIAAVAILLLGIGIGMWIDDGPTLDELSVDPAGAGTRGAGREPASTTAVSPDAQPATSLRPADEAALQFGPPIAATSLDNASRVSLHTLPAGMRRPSPYDWCTDREPDAPELLVDQVRSDGSEQTSRLPAWSAERLVWSGGSGWLVPTPIVFDVVAAIKVAPGAGALTVLKDGAEVATAAVTPDGWALVPRFAGSPDGVTVRFGGVEVPVADQADAAAKPCGFDPATPRVTDPDVLRDASLAMSRLYDPRGSRDSRLEAVVTADRSVLGPAFDRVSASPFAAGLALTSVRISKLVSLAPDRIGVEYQLMNPSAERIRTGELHLDGGAWRVVGATACDDLEFLGTLCGV